MSSTIPTVPATILAQLGGTARICAMAFERVVYDEESVTLHVARSLRRGTRDRVTHIGIALAPNDTYTVVLWRVRAGNFTVVAEVAGVDAANLRELLEARTGLRLSLGTMRAPAVAS